MRSLEGIGGLGEALEFPEFAGVRAKLDAYDHAFERVVSAQLRAEAGDEFNRLSLALRSHGDLFQTASRELATRIETLRAENR